MRTSNHLELRISERYFGELSIPEVVDAVIAAAAKAKKVVDFTNHKGQAKQYAIIFFEGEYWGLGIADDFNVATTLLTPYMVEKNRERKGFLESYIA